MLQSMVTNEAPFIGEPICPVLAAMTRQQHDIGSVAGHVPNCVECGNVAAVFARLAVTRAGRSKSPAKADAARRNGRLGGRPRRLLLMNP